MDLVSLRQQHTTWAIQQNPTIIIVNRTEKIDKGGYFEEIKSEAGPFTVRIFTQGTQVLQGVSTLAGTKQLDKTWGMLADWQADIKAGPNVLDEFDVPGLGSFQVVGVFPQKMNGSLVGYQVALEKVS
ncbi:MAG: hypothetical protein HQP61_02205 [Peptococcaceae bacterium]|nr:hypothetical protein [Candidatus Syntrophopropionicum ammoniitolerans]